MMTYLSMKEHSSPAFSAVIFFVSLCLVLCIECSPAPIAGGRRRHHTPHAHPLTHEYYSKTCPQLEHLVSQVTSQQFREVPISGPATIRLFFHDCFVEVKHNRITHKSCPLVNDACKYRDVMAQYSSRRNEKGCW